MSAEDRTAPRQPRYDVLLFDADDTLFDFGACEKQAFRRALASAGIEEKPGMLETYSTCNVACWEAFERGELEKSALVVKRFALFLEHYGIGADPARLNEEYLARLSEAAILFDGAAELLARLSECADIYVVTNGVTRVQKSRYARAGLDRYVKRVFISEEMGVKKPDARFFEAVGREIPGFEKKRALVIGDSLTSDVLGANNAGIDCLWFNRKNKAAPDGLRITAIARDYRETEAFIMGEPA